jgi:hypothetical protein
MGPVFTKLNLKEHPEVVVLNAPLSFEPELAWLADRRVARDLDGVAQVRFALAFALQRAELERLVADLVPKVDGDAVLWIAYPKKSSRRYKADFDRDHGWASLGDAGFEPVRQVSIDEDWSALRFRRVEHIKSLRRDPKMAISPGGRERVG